MECANCQAMDGIAYTLRTHVSGDDRTVDLHFCSVDCLRAWTRPKGARSVASTETQADRATVERPDDAVDVTAR